MNFATSKSVNTAAQRRLQINADRARARPVRAAYPGVELIQIELTFAGIEVNPSPQTHSMYPAAQAFFRFPCPCVDCDGELDLSEVLIKLAEARSAKSARRSISGKSSCLGVHWRESQRSAPCRIEFRYRVSVKNAE